MARPHSIFLVLLVAAMASPMVLAYDPSALQDFCVADYASNVFVNGMACKDPKLVTAGDFAFSGLQNPGDTANAVGSNSTLVDVHVLPGLNSLGISLARLDVAPFGLNPPHTHPRGTEMLTVVEGELYVGFITTDGKLFAKVVSSGGVFVYPKGLVHFAFNLRARPAWGIVGLSSQNPGLIRVAESLFGAVPGVTDEVLAKAFRIDTATVQMIKAKF
ncbi:putative germin-like protein 2-3 [Phragmites australis]|uniref:putative germin-like protein 2-3 n=1 Tax=Phragmites australis TaxID=29695 RepID=UPI002D766CC5|nr:putative germin-like protein 2-3 [Phragmites australis]